MDLLQRERAKIQKDLEQLQLTKTTAFKEYDSQIERKKQELIYITKEVERAQGFCHLYSKQLAELKKEMELSVSASKLQKDRAEEDVRLVYVNANKAKEAVTKREIEVTTRENCVLKRENDILIIEEKIKQDSQKISEGHEVIANRRRELVVIENESKTTLAERQKLINNLDRQIKTKQTQVSTMELQIEEMGKRAEKIGIESKIQLKKALQMIEEYTKREGLLDERDKELNKKEVYLNDKSKTIRRAYNEVLSRGGHIDG